MAAPCNHHGSVTGALTCSRCGMALAVVDALRGLPPPRQRRLLERVDAELGPEATAALETALAFHRRPVQRFPGPRERQGIVVYTGDFAAGKTWTALMLLHYLILTGRARAPRIVAATGADARSLIAHSRTGLWTCWKQPGVAYDWKVSEGWEGILKIDGTPLVLCSVEAPKSVLGVGCDVQLLDDPPKWGPTGKPLLINALRSGRERGALTIIPTTADGLVILAEVLGVRVENLADAGVLVIDLGATEANSGNLDPSYFVNRANMMRAGTWDPLGSVSPWAPVLAELGARILAMVDPVLEEMAISIDPAQSTGTRACEVGIVGGGRDPRATVHTRHDRSGVMDSGLNGWPAQSWKLAADMQREQPGVPWHFVLESNMGKRLGELLRGEERARRMRGDPVPLPGGSWAQGRQEVSVCEIRLVRADKDKCKRAESPARLASQGQVRHARGLEELEGQQRNLTPMSTSSDRADAENHMITDLAGLAEAGLLDPGEANRAAMRGLAAAQERMPAPPWAPAPEVAHGADDWDRV